MDIGIVIIFVCILIIALSFAVAGLRGAVWVPVFTRDLKVIHHTLQLEQGSVLYEFGCGDGRLLRLAAKSGVNAIGYEINPFMALVAKILSWRSGAKIYVADAWTKSFSPADVVFVFLMPKYMKRVGEKMKSELKSGTILVTYIYPIPDMEHYRHEANAYFYKIN